MDGHLLDWTATHKKEDYYRVGIWHLPLTHKTNTRWQPSWMFTYHPQDARMVTHHSKDCHPPSKIWSLTFPNFVTNFVTHFSKDSHHPSPVWSNTIPSMATNHHCHIPYPWWSPTNSRMVLTTIPRTDMPRSNLLVAKIITLSIQIPHL